MYNVSNAFKTAIANTSRCIKARITLGTTVIDGDYIQKINLSHDIMPGGDFQIGTAPMVSVEISLIDKDGALASVSFQDQELYLEFGATLADNSVEYVPMGYFKVTEAPTKKKITSLKAVDRMHKFEKDYVTSLAFPTTLGVIAAEICTQAGVTLATTTFPNSDLVVTVAPTLTGITLRKAIAQVAELAGGWAQINRAGELEIKCISMAQSSITNYAGSGLLAGAGARLINDSFTVPNIDLTTTHYISFEGAEQAMATIDKVIVKTGDVEATKGTGINPVYVVDNIFCQTPSAAVDALYTVLNGIGYQPCNFKWLGNPAIDTGDLIRITTKNGSYLTVLASRQLSYSGGLREVYSAPAKSNTAKESKHEGSLAIAIKKAVARISLLADSISLLASQESVDNLGTRMDSAEAKITPTAIVQSINTTDGVGKVKTSLGKMDNDGFEISHTDVGTKTRMAANGFKIKDAATDEDLASFGTDNGLPNIRVNQAYIYGRKMIEERAVLYINSSTGNDLTADGSSAKPYKTISSAINSLGRLLSRDMYVYITGTFYENIEVNGICGAGVVRMNMAGSTLYGNFDIKNCSVFIDIYGEPSNYGNIIATGTGQPANVNQCTGVKLSYLNLDGGGLASSVINMWMSFLSAINCTVKGGTAYGMYFTTCNAYVYSCKGSNTGYGIFAGAGSRIGISGNIPSGTLAASITDGTSVITGTGTATGDGSSAGTTITTIVCYATGTGSWRNSDGWRDNGRVYQGAYQSSQYGINKGMFFFGSDAFNAMIGHTIKSAMLHIKRYSGGGSSAAQAIYFYAHGYESQPAGEPSLGVDLGNLCSLAWGEEAVIALPQAFLSGVSGGSIKGIAVYHGAVNPYVILCNNSEYTASIEFQFL